MSSSGRITIDCNSRAEDIPSPRSMRRWIRAALPSERAGAEVCVRIVDEREGSALNARFRRKRNPTNVLSFPAALPTELSLPLLGDIVICAPVVGREAREQGKAARAHWAHVLVHGTLHLLGFDHQRPREAQRMEATERAILASLNFPDPYQDDDSQRRP